MKTSYQCENCQKFTTNRGWIFNCIECGKEICDDCMHGWATCKTCAQGKTDAELKKRFEEENS